MQEQKEVKLRTRAEVLMAYHNTNLNSLLAHAININLMEGKDDDEVVAIVPTDVPGSEGQPVMQEIRVKRAKISLRKQYQGAVELLLVCEALLEKEGVKIEDSVKTLPLLEELKKPTAK